MQLKMDQVLFLGGKLINGIRAVDRFRSVQRLSYSVKEQEVILATTQIFYQSILAGKLAEIQEEGLATAQRHLTRVELLSAEGQVRGWKWQNWSLRFWLPAISMIWLWPLFANRSG